MTATQIKIENKKYRIISEQDYITLMEDIKELKKVLKRKVEKGTEAKAFFKQSEKK